MNLYDFSIKITENKDVKHLWNTLPHQNLN